MKLVEELRKDSTQTVRDIEAATEDSKRRFVELVAKGARLHKAHMVGNDMASPNAGPKPSAMMVATQRHQLLDHPLVLDDAVALTLLGSAEAQSLRDNLDRFRHPACSNGSKRACMKQTFLCHHHCVPVHFERVGLAEGLACAGFNPDAPAIFSWLGV